MAIPDLLPSSFPPFCVPHGGHLRSTPLCHALDILSFLSHMRAPPDSTPWEVMCCHLLMALIQDNLQFPNTLSPHSKGYYDNLKGCYHSFLHLQSASSTSEISAFPQAGEASNSSLTAELDSVLRPPPPYSPRDTKQHLTTHRG